MPKLACVGGALLLKGGGGGGGGGHSLRSFCARAFGALHLRFFLVSCCPVKLTQAKIVVPDPDYLMGYLGVLMGYKWGISGVSMWYEEVHCFNQNQTSILSGN